MNFITILSIFLIISFQFSSLVSGDSSYGSGYGLTQISTSKTTNKNGGLSNNGYLFGKRDHKEKDHKEKDHKEKDHKSHSDENSEEVTTEKTTEPIGIVKGTNLICEYCG